MSLALVIATIMLADAGAATRPDAGVPLWGVTHALPRDSERNEFPLRRSGDGYVYQEQAFEAYVSHDGVVSFHDRNALLGQVSFQHGPAPPGEDLRSALWGHANAKPIRAPAPVGRQPSSPAGPLRPSEICPPESCYALPDTLVVLAGGATMDLTDEMMRDLGQHPYAAQKARFLAATFQVRMRLAAAAGREDMQKSLAELPGKLAHLWADSRYSLRERRRILFELWRETDDTADGMRAMEAIESFIRRQLPCGSPSAFTPAELAAYRRDDRRFSPYAGCKN